MHQTGQIERPSPHDTPSAFRTLAPVFFYFAVGGIATVMLGPLLPSLIQRWNIQDAQAGTLFTANFTGQLCGAWFAARNLRTSVLYGTVMTAAGCAAMAWASFGIAHIALFCIGTGLGAGLTAGNIIAGTAVPALRARLLAILNVDWGIGAIACPLLVHATAAGGVGLFFFLTSALLATAALFAITIPRQIRSIAPATLASQSSSNAKPRIPLSHLHLFLFGAAMLLYVGVENALGGWLPSYAARTNLSARAASISLYFWIAELCGRLLVAGLMALISEATLYRSCLALLILTQALLCLAVHLSVTSLATLTILSGLTLAPVYPLLISFLLARTGNNPRLGSLFAVASLGGATLPWLTGIVSTHFHGLRAGLLVPATGAILLLSMSAVITAKPSSAPKPTPS